MLSAILFFVTALFKLWISPHLRGGVLDLVLSNSDGLVKNVLSFSSKFLRSDHYLLSFTVPSARKRVSEQSKLSYSFNFKKTDLGWLSSFLLDFDFSQIFSSNDIELVWSLLKGIILHFIKLFTPVIRVRSKSYPKWFHSAIRHQLHRVHYLRRWYRKHQSPMRSSQLSSAELQLQHDIVLARSTYETDLVTKFAFSNDSRICQYIRNLWAT